MRYVNHQKLNAIISNESKTSIDHSLEALRLAVREKVHALDEPYRQIIVMYYFENQKLDSIAKETGLCVPQINKHLGEALLILKYSLAEIVKKRWPNRFANDCLCPVCSHPQKHKIEMILLSKKNNESWGIINKRLKKAVKTAFNPPIILLNHLRYHMKDLNND
ncbi:MAG: sigma-70 family RNA polymerase sigma factor [candidate division Zixibacteria bacterium]|nr:sigma-70 family RNA polymerase sigma factor [candidate division Zixibacteria bacterium]